MYGDDVMTLFETQIGNAQTAFPHFNVRTWLFDPPYNVNFKYGDKVKDNLNEVDYHNLIFNSVRNMWNHSEEDANLFLVNYPHISARLLPTIEEAGWRLKQWITWVYPSNIGMSKKKFTTASRAVLWFVKGEPKAFIDQVLQPYKNPNDKRIKERIANGSKGFHLYYWWNINLRKITSKGFVGWYNQLPTELVKRMILITTNEGDCVGDLMAGGGTLAEVALPLKRHTFLNDIDEKALKHWGRYQ